MDIRQLDYFLSVAQRGNFTKAADDLFITRQALSKAIKNLEHELGEPLFTNRDNHLELTEKGRALLGDAMPVIKEFKQLQERYTGPSARITIRRSLSVAMAHGTAFSLPENAIDSFRMHHPDILLSVESVTTETAIEMVKASESDVSLVGSTPRYLADFSIQLVVETGLHIFVPRENCLAQKGKLSLLDLEGQPFVTFGKRNHLHRCFLEACAQAGVHPNIVITTSDVELLLRSADQQGALYFGFPTTIHPAASQTHVLLPLELGNDISFGTYAIKKKDADLSSSAHAFWEHLSCI